MTPLTTQKVLLTLQIGCSDADLERLLEQWEEDDEPLPADELPEGHPNRPEPKLDLSKFMFFIKSIYYLSMVYYYEYICIIYYRENIYLLYICRI